MQRIGIIFQMKESDMLSALGKWHWTAAKVMHLLARRMLFPLVCGVVQLSTLHPPAHSDEAFVLSQESYLVPLTNCIEQGSDWRCWRHTYLDTLICSCVSRQMDRIGHHLCQ